MQYFSSSLNLLIICKLKMKNNFNIIKVKHLISEIKMIFIKTNTKKIRHKVLMLMNQ